MNCFGPLDAWKLMGIIYLAVPQSIFKKKGATSALIANKSSEGVFLQPEINKKDSGQFSAKIS
jgi:hypothetical protein